jgi:uncharacterized protein (DUF1697 family)
MPAYASMLRGINVGGQKKLAMQTLSEIYTDLGYKNVQTYVQSGNVVFTTAKADPAELVMLIEAAIEAETGYEVKVFIRQVKELKRLLEGNPFLGSRNEDPAWLHVTFLYASPVEGAWKKVIAPQSTRDEFVRGKDFVYLFCPNGYGKTKLSGNFFERKLGVPTTTRNWNTVNALYKMME